MVSIKLFSGLYVFFAISTSYTICLTRHTDYKKSKVVLSHFRYFLIVNYIKNTVPLLAKKLAYTLVFYPTLRFYLEFRIIL